MAYDEGIVVTYVFGVHDFGTAGEALAIKPPAGYSRGRILDVGIAVTETFAGTSTSGFVRIGTAADPDAYAELNITAAGDGAAADTNYFNTLDDPDAIIEADIPSATQLEVAFVAPTGGTAAGMGFVHIVIRWY